MNSLFDDSLLQFHSNNDPLLTGNDTPTFGHESHNDLFNQNLLPEAHQYNDSYQESYSDNAFDVGDLFNQEINTLEPLSNDSPTFEHHFPPSYESTHLWDNSHLDVQKAHEIVCHSREETVGHVHFWGRTDSTYMGSDSGDYDYDSNDSNNSKPISDSGSNKCVDNNQDGVCDNNDSNCGDSSGSCGSSSSGENDN